MNNQIKTVIIPDNNDMIPLASFQKTLSGIPLYPFYFISEEDFFSEEVKNVELEEELLVTDDRIQLSAQIHLKDKSILSTLPLVKLPQNSKNSIPQVHGLKLNLNVFLVAKILFEEDSNSLTWTILEKKWVNTKKLK